MSQGLTFSVLTCHRALGHQVVHFFPLVGVLSSVKQLRKCASDTVPQRGANAEDVGEGSGLRRPLCPEHRRAIRKHGVVSKCLLGTLLSAKLWTPDKSSWSPVSQMCSLNFRNVV